MLRELDIHLVVNLESTVHGLGPIFAKSVAYLVILLAVVFLVTVICVIHTGSSRLVSANLLHVFLLLDALGPLVFLALIQTDVAEENGSHKVDIG